MNPLDLPGPAFLKFYLVFGIVVIAIARWIRSRLQDAEPPHRAIPRFSVGHYPRESEAYHIAYLRGGAEEVKNTARVLTETQLQPYPPAAAPHVSHIEKELEREGMIFRGSMQQPFFRLTTITVLLLVAMAGAKIVVALSRGRTNIGFLILLTVLFGLAALFLLKPPRITKAAREYLAWLNRAHDGLLTLVNQGRNTSTGEVALCAAIYGLAPITTAPIAQLRSKLQKEAAARNARQTGSSAVFASSCGSSCGGGCGGGGCGGCGS